MSHGFRRITHAAYPARCRPGVLRAGRNAPPSGAHGFSNLFRPRAALANKVRVRRLEEWKQKKLQRTPFAIPDEPLDDLRPKRGRKSFRPDQITSPPEPSIPARHLHRDCPLLLHRRRAAPRILSQSSCTTSRAQKTLLNMGLEG